MLHLVGGFYEWKWMQAIRLGFGVAKFWQTTAAYRSTLSTGGWKWKQRSNIACLLCLKRLLLLDNVAHPLFKFCLLLLASISVDMMYDDVDFFSKAACYNTLN